MAAFGHVGKKDRLAALLSATGTVELLRLCRGLVGASVPMLAYHRVVEPGEQFKYDIELISAVPEEFAWQMRYLSEHANPITFDQLERILDGQTTAPPYPVIVTFDDGFDDNYYNAFPVLRELGIPATVFVSTGNIGSEKSFWFDRVAGLLNGGIGRTFVDPASSLALVVSEEPQRRREQILSLIEHLALAKDLERDRLLGRLEATFGTGGGKACDPASRPMTWAHLREMADAGIEIGSHTVTHPLLAQLDEQALREELEASKAAITREIGRPVSVLAYPVGRRDLAYDERVMRATRDAGYRFGVSYEPGNNRLSRLRRYELRRLHVERYTSRPRFKAMLSVPELFG